MLSIKKIIILGVTTLMATSSFLLVGANATDKIKVVVSKDSRTFHTHTDCSRVTVVAKEKRKVISKTLDELTEAGYRICKSCDNRDKNKGKADFFLECEDESDDNEIVTSDKSTDSNDKVLSQKLIIE